MRKHLPWLALCVAVGLNACAAGPQPQFPSARLDTARACADWRWIGISRPGARCPDVPGWTVRPLFAQLAPALEERACENAEKTRQQIKVVQELNRFCVYEIADPRKSLKQLPFPPAVTADLVRFDQDCAALALTDTDLVAQSWTPDAKVFLAQAGGPRKPLEINNRLGVRLAFLDTQPTGEGVPTKSGNSMHGYTLARLAQQLVCAPGSPDRCAAQITTQLALPIIEFNPEDPSRSRIDKDRGGYLGMQSNLAEAVRDEVDAWLPKRSSQRHLILNLSLAWDPELFGGRNERQVAEMRAGTQAVYRALQYAAGFDVLVLAAAGNQKQDPCANFGPLLPAAWERGGPREESCGAYPEAPLVYAVGGLQADGSPLANARPGGMPRRAAYGATELFAGSSVATAVASSIAAVVWDTVPSLSPSEVMAILDGTGNGTALNRRVSPKVLNDLLPLKADFWFGANASPPPGALAVGGPGDQDAPAVRRLSLCTVLEQACEEHPDVACPLHSSCEPERLARASLSKPDASKTAPKGSCQPWLYPQPEYDPCPGCPPPKPGS
jgi:hypothetical protein